MLGLAVTYPYTYARTKKVFEAVFGSSAVKDGELQNMNISEQVLDRLCTTIVYGLSGSFICYWFWMIFSL